MNSLIIRKNTEILREIIFKHTFLIEFYFRVSEINLKIGDIFFKQAIIWLTLEIYDPDKTSTSTKPTIIMKVFR